jgi:hypothetical protein
LTFIYLGGRGRADPDNTAINVLIWRGRYLAVAATAVLAIGCAGARHSCCRLVTYGSSCGWPDTRRHNFPCYDINVMTAIAMLNLIVSGAWGGD